MISARPLARGLAASMLLGTTIAAGALAATPLTADAAASHYNTDPYSTGCADSKLELSSRAVPGGTAKVWFSNTCGTNWISYQSSAPQDVWMKGWDAQSGKNTTLQHDVDVTWAYSMQSYAPGTTKFQGYWTIGGQDVGVTCQGGCTWSGATDSTSTTTTSTISTFKSYVLDSANWNSKTQSVSGSTASPYGQPGIDVKGPNGYQYGAQCADLARLWSRMAGKESGFDGGRTADQGGDGWYVAGRTFASAKPGDIVTLVKGDRHVVVVTGAASGGYVPVVQQNPKSPHVANYSTASTGVVWRKS